jgi:hypothetical protein
LLYPFELTIAPPQFTIVPEVPSRVNRQVFAEMKRTGKFGDIAAVYDGAFFLLVSSNFAN